MQGRCWVRCLNPEPDLRARFDRSDISQRNRARQERRNACSGIGVHESKTVAIMQSSRSRRQLPCLSIWQTTPAPEPRSTCHATELAGRPARFREGSELRERAVLLLGFRPVPMFVTRISFCGRGAGGILDGSARAVLLCNSRRRSPAEGHPQVRYLQGADRRQASSDAGARCRVSRSEARTSKSNAGTLSRCTLSCMASISHELHRARRAVSLPDGTCACNFAPTALSWAGFKYWPWAPTLPAVCTLLTRSSTASCMTSAPRPPIYLDHCPPSSRLTLPLL